MHMEDRIVPLPLMEQPYPMKEIITNACLVISGQLNPSALQDSLGKLVEIWPILGARLRKNNDGRLEYHIPNTFSQERLPFVFSVEHHEGSIPCLPKRTTETQPDVMSMMYLFRSMSCPRTVSQMMKQNDAPIINLHVSCFSDVTCIGFSLPHCVADAPGMGIILHAWCSVLAGKASELPKLYDRDPLATFGSPYPSKKADAKKFRESMQGAFQILNFWTKIPYYAGLLPEFIFHPKEESRMLFIPMKLVEKLRDTALSELREKSGKETMWVSENDIVTALLVKLNNLHHAKKDITPFTMVFVANMRGQIPALPKDSPSVWVHNATTPFTTPPVPTTSLQAMSIGQIALHIRDTIIAQKPAEQREKQVTVYREMARRGDYPVYYSPPGRAFFVTSWATARWTDLDFSPATLDSEKTAPAYTGRVIFAGGYSNIESLPRRFWCILMSKQSDDEFGEGGYWCEMAARRSAWPAMDAYLSSLSF